MSLSVAFPTDGDGRLSMFKNSDDIVSNFLFQLCFLDSIFDDVCHGCVQMAFNMND